MPGKRFGVFRLGESPKRGHRPAAVFQERWLALLATAVLPGTGRDAAFRLHKESGPDGFAMETGNGGEPVGHSALFDEQLIEALHVVERLVRSPEALARVMERQGRWRSNAPGRFSTSGFRRWRAELVGRGGLGLHGRIYSIRS